MRTTAVAGEGPWPRLSMPQDPQCCPGSGGHSGRRGEPGDLILVPHSPPGDPESPLLSVTWDWPPHHQEFCLEWAVRCEEALLGEGRSGRPHGDSCAHRPGPQPARRRRGSLCQAGCMRLEPHDWGSPLGLACKLCDLGKCLTVWPSVVSSGKWAHS